MCSVSGYVGTNPDIPAAGFAYEMNHALYHRGQEGSGIATLDLSNNLKSHESAGAPSNVFDAERIIELGGKMAVGQNLYSTYGLGNIQPIIDNDLGFAFTHNGNIPDTDMMDAFLENHNIQYQNMNDSNKMSRVIGQHIRDGYELPDAINASYNLFKGAFSCIAMHAGVMVAFRDQAGVKPLESGSRKDGIAFASETAGLDKINASYTNEVKSGGMQVIDSSGNIEYHQIVNGMSKLDMFEFVYFARPDSKLYGLRVAMVRRKFGEILAREHPPLTDDPDNILVVPVPETSTHTAEAYAEAHNLKHSSSIVKERLSGRTFMNITNELRDEALKRKHAIIPEMLTGKDLIVIDDSIVRFNTLPRIIKLLKSAKPKSITVLIGSAPIGYPDFYGTDTPKQDELAAFNYSPEDLRDTLDILDLKYLSLDGMIEATGLSASKFNLSPFNGDYSLDIGKVRGEISNPRYMNLDIN